MSSSILSVGQSALAAAQVGLTTTGHNIANANTPGYSRQIVIQGTASAQDGGFGFIGKGTDIIGIRRVFNDFLSDRVMSAQISQGETNTYYAQIQQINNMFADTTSGFSPRLQEFFKSVQDVASNPNSDGARQTLLSSAQTLAAQFGGMDAQLHEMSDGVNSQIRDSVTTINSYAQQISDLNDAIEKAQAGSDNKPANDLLDQRDNVVSQLSKEIKVSIAKQGDSYNVFIGNGQPLVVGTKAFNLVTTGSTTDPTRLEVGYQSNGQTIQLAENSIAGGRLGGLFQFRSQTLDATENGLDRLAASIATSFNAQHKLGQDKTGTLGKNFFSFNTLPVSPSSGATGTLSAAVSDVSALTTSDYQLRYDGANYTVTRMADGKTMYSGNAFPAAANQAIEGVTLSQPAPPAAQIAAGDSFLVRPVNGAAASFAVALRDTSEIAAAAPIRTVEGTLSAAGSIVNNNTGTGKVSAGSVDANYLASPLAGNVTLTYDSSTAPANLKFSTAAGTPATFTLTQANGTSAIYTYNAASVPPGYFDNAAVPNGPFAGVPYTSGATVTFNGISVSVSGAPANGDQFTIAPNTSGVGDNRNALLLAGLQTANTMGKSLVTGMTTSTFQGSFAQIVNGVGNKTHELEVTGSAEDKLLDEAVKAQQADSGVNLDEEATNLIRYQQAYQAAGKVMQTASQLFDILLHLGGS
jgi:flagellar hook-associated protein 1